MMVFQNPNHKYLITKNKEKNNIYIVIIQFAISTNSWLWGECVAMGSHTFIVPDIQDFIKSG